MTTKKRKQVRAKRRVKKTRVAKPKVRLDLMLDAELKEWMRRYARRKNKSLSALVTDHFTELKAEDEMPDVRQI